jgi:hypothetical protein
VGGSHAAAASWAGRWSIKISESCQALGCPPRCHDDQCEAPQSKLGPGAASLVIGELPERRAFSCLDALSSACAFGPHVRRRPGSDAVGLLASAAGPKSPAPTCPQDKSKFASPAAEGSWWCLEKNQFMLGLRQFLGPKHRAGVGWCGCETVELASPLSLAALVPGSSSIRRGPNGRFAGPLGELRYPWATVVMAASSDVRAMVRVSSGRPQHESWRRFLSGPD